MGLAPFERLTFYSMPGRSRGPPDTSGKCLPEATPQGSPFLIEKMEIGASNLAPLPFLTGGRSLLREFRVPDCRGNGCGLLETGSQTR
jgi:hypothetical protein